MGTFLGSLLRTLFLLVCWWLLGVFVVLPCVLAAGPIGLAAGTVVGLILIGQVLGPASPSPVLSPRDFAARPLPARRVRLYIRRDRAWPNYFAGQARIDHATMTLRFRDTCARLWEVPHSSWVRLGAQHPALRLTLWPLALIVLAFQAAATLTGALVLVAATVVMAATSAVFWACGTAIAVLLRTADRLWRGVFRAKGSCPTGFHTFAVPTYRCGGAHTPAEVEAGSDLHRDIRAGRQGVLYRRCECGNLLPTMVLRAASSQQALCPYCLDPLSRGTGLHTDVRLPYFGATSAGKTNLIMAAAVALKQAAEKNGLRWSLPDEHSRTEFARYEQRVQQGQNAPKTAGGVPAAVTVTIAKRHRGAMVRFFDAAGETLADSAQNADLTYLEKSGGLIFVLDPFSIPDVRGQFETAFSDLFVLANAAVDNPQKSYTTTVSRLRDLGVNVQRRHLSFVVSKADLLAKLPSQPASDSSADIAAWLCLHLESNLIRMAQRDFAEVRFFLATVHNGQTIDAYRVIEWLLAKEGVRLD